MTAPGSLRDRLAVECGRVIGDLLNGRHGTGLEPLCWRVVTDPSGWVRSAVGQVPATTDAQALADLAAWADRHHLVLAADPVRGTGEVHGRINGLPVQIWAVTDRAAFEAETTISAGSTTGTGGRS